MYSFELHFAKHKPAWLLADTQALYVSGICLAAKNAKYGQFYFSKYIKSMKGTFAKVAGSHSYPMLFPNGNKVVLYVENFPKYPKLIFNELETKWKTHITIENIQYNKSGISSFQST